MIAKRLRKNNLTIALNILYIKEKQICPAYISRINSNSEIRKQIILLIIPNEENWDYLPVKKTVCITKWNNIMVIFIAWIEDTYGTAIPTEKHNILELNREMTSDKVACIIYADMKSLIKKVDGCANNLENSSTAQIGERIRCRYSISKIWAFNHTENKHTLSWGRLFVVFLKNMLQIY